MAEEQDSGQTQDETGTSETSEETSGKTGESYWQGEFDKLKATGEKDAEENGKRDKLWTLFKDNPDLVNHMNTFWEESKSQESNDEFDPSVDFDIDKALLEPDSPSGKYLASKNPLFAPKDDGVGNRVKKIEEDNKEKEYIEGLMKMGYKEDGARAFLGNVRENPEKFLMETLAPALVKATVEGANLDDIRKTQEGPESVVEIQGSAPFVPKSETDKLFDDLSERNVKQFNFKG